MIRPHFVKLEGDEEFPYINAACTNEGDIHTILLLEEDVKNGSIEITCDTCNSTETYYINRRSDPRYIADAIGIVALPEKGQGLDKNELTPNRLADRMQEGQLEKIAVQDRIYRIPNANNIKDLLKTEDNALLRTLRQYMIDVNNISRGGAELNIGPLNTYAKKHVLEGLPFLLGIYHPSIRPVHDAIGKLTLYREARIQHVIDPYTIGIGYTHKVDAQQIQRHDRFVASLQLSNRSSI